MKLSKLMLAFATLALAVASAASSYKFSIFQPSTIGGTELKPGDYKVEVNGDKAMIKIGKKTTSAGKSSSVESSRPVRNSRICAACCMCRVTTPASACSKKLIGNPIR